MAPLHYRLPRISRDFLLFRTKFIAFVARKITTLLLRVQKVSNFVYQSIPSASLFLHNIISRVTTYHADDLRQHLKHENWVNWCTITECFQNARLEEEIMSNAKKSFESKEKIYFSKSNKQRVLCRIESGWECLMWKLMKLTKIRVNESSLLLNQPQSGFINSGDFNVISPHDRDSLD